MTNNLIKLLSFSNSSVINNQSNVFNFNKQNNTLIGPVWKNNVNRLLKSYFSSLYCLISKPVFIITPDKITIHVSYYRYKLPDEKRKQIGQSFWYKWYHAKAVSENKLQTRVLSALNTNNGRKLFLPSARFHQLAAFLSHYLQTNVELELVQLKYPYHDSEILCQLIGLNGKKYNYQQIKSRLFIHPQGASVLPKSEHLTEIKKEKIERDLNPSVLDNKKSLASKLTGIKIRLAGRLPRQRIVPKKTVKTAYKGGISKSVVNYVDSSSYINKGRRGSFCVKVTLSHGI